MKKFIKLHSFADKKPIYVNMDLLGHFYEVPEDTDRYNRKVGGFTRVGVVTHNNGSFEVVESVTKIVSLINEMNLQS